jgi:hypothetical protein
MVPVTLDEGERAPRLARAIDARSHPVARGLVSH